MKMGRNLASTETLESNEDVCPGSGVLLYTQTTMLRSFSILRSEGFALVVVCSKSRQSWGWRALRTCRLEIRSPAW